MSKFMERTKAKMDARKKLRRKTEVQKPKAPSRKPLYFEWLEQALNMDRLPTKVDLKKVPTAFRQPLTHKFRLSYHAAKADMCKPFARHR
jgi:hypothetical protein